jgi:hypothetical protein
MATPKKLLAASLDILRKAERDGVVRSSKIGRTHRERLLRNGFLEEVVKGWLIVTNPSVQKGSSTSWYFSFWSFIRQYLTERYDEGYCLSPEASIKIHTDSTVIPKQLIAITKKKGVQNLPLPFNTSLLMYQDRKNFPDQRVKKNGLWIMDLPAALCRVSPAFFRNEPNEAELALRMIRNASPLLHILLEKGSTSVAGRLAGAYYHLGETRVAGSILKGMTAAGLSVRPSNPFERFSPALAAGTRFISPYVARIESLWNSMKGQVMEIFPEAPGIPKNPDKYLKRIDEIYVNDAYNSLSIEGYRVTPELVERIRDGRWDPESAESDTQQREAMAAKGYNLAFQSVKGSIMKILRGENPAEVAETGHQEWYSRMFSPSVQAGLLKPSDLAGYRNGPVFIQNSQHVPPPKEAVLDCMEIFFDLLKREKDAGVRSVLGHFIFVYIHPYLNGNGRIGRFLMNVMLASGGYPWTVIRLERRKQYMAALEDASVHSKIMAFAKFIGEEMEHS